MTQGRTVLGYEILAMREACRKMVPYQRNDCPFCSWALETAADGIIHCNFCGWQDQTPLHRDVPRV